MQRMPGRAAHQFRRSYGVASVTTAGRFLAGYSGLTVVSHVVRWMGAPTAGGSPPIRRSCTAFHGTGSSPSPPPMFVIFVSRR